MPFYADILPMRKGNFRGREYIKAQYGITENFQFRFQEIDKNTLIWHFKSRLRIEYRKSFSSFLTQYAFTLLTAQAYK